MSQLIIPKLTEIEFRVQFKQKLEELQKWGIDNGFFITAYLDLNPNGAVPRIGYRPVKQEEMK